MDSIMMDDEIVEIVDDDFVMPLELVEAAKRGTASEVLPETSKSVYMKTYNAFQKWRNEKKANCISEKVLMVYFYELSEKNKPSSLWAYYSMLKATIKLKDNIDISTFHQLIGFLKSKSSGFRSVASKVFSEADMHKFIFEASDLEWLDVKVVCIFAVSGALGSDELIKITVDDVESHGNDLFLVRVPKTRRKMPRTFTISGLFYGIVQKYASLRVPGTQDRRFFVNYQRGKCVNQVIGKNKLNAMPRRIATFLKLKEVERYTGHSFRRTSLTIVAKTGASMEAIKSHGSLRSKVTDSYVEDSHTGDRNAATISSASEGYVNQKLQYPLDAPVQFAKLETVGQSESGSIKLQGTLVRSWWDRFSPDNQIRCTVWFRHPS